MNKKEVVQSYLDVYIDAILSGDMNKSQLARKISSENPGLFSTPNAARVYVKDLTLPSRNNRSIVPDEKHVFKSNIKHGLKALPKSEARKIKDFEFPHKKPLVISDIHIPYQDNEALLTTIEFAKGKVDSVLINGDLLDMYQCSKFTRDPRNASIVDELETGLAFISWLKQELNVPIFYKLGNHEDRWEKYLWRKAPEIVGVEVLEFSGLLKYYKWPVTVIEQNQKIKFGKLNILHGHEFPWGIYSPVNPARGVFIKTMSNTLVGHWHQSSYHPGSNLSKDLIACWSTGCLCTLQPEYSPLAFLKWNHGFALIEKMSSGNFRVDSREIIDGEVV